MSSVKKEHYPVNVIEKSLSGFFIALMPWKIDKLNHIELLYGLAWASRGVCDILIKSGVCVNVGRGRCVVRREGRVRIGRGARPNPLSDMQARIGCDVVILLRGIEMVADLNVGPEVEEKTGVRLGIAQFAQNQAFSHTTITNHC